VNRRSFLLSALALPALAWPQDAGLAEPPFQPTRFSVEVRGSGPDVILIPGLTAGRDVWQGTTAAVAGYRYHLVQVAGMAGEPARGNAQGPVVAPLAEELARYIESRSLDRPAIVGHSMGGTLAMMVAARRPELVGRVMVVDMYPQAAALIGASSERVRGLADSLRGLAATEGGRRLFQSLIGSFGTDGRSDPDVVGRAMHELSSLDLTGDLPRIRAPLTVAYAVRDERSRARTDQAFATAYARARGVRLVPIVDSSHMIMFDQPARLHAAVRAFLTN
jgi:pimeloyl-ACP methyl ester carboxylesterase